MLDAHALSRDLARAARGTEAQRAAALRKHAGDLSKMCEELIELRETSSPDTVRNAISIGLYGLAASVQNSDRLADVLETFLADHLLPFVIEQHGRDALETVGNRLRTVVDEFCPLRGHNGPPA